MTDELITHLMEDLNSTNDEEVQSAKHAIKSTGSFAIPHLIQAVESGSTLQSKHATQVLKDLKSPELLPQVLEALESKNATPRCLINLLELWLDLVQIQGMKPCGFSAFRSLVKYEDVRIRLLVLEALLCFSPETYKTLMNELANDSEQQIRSRAQSFLRGKQTVPEMKPFPLVS